ncbi:hypothetical protein [Hyalangium gracile]|uniref:hypothetical protein n=1 Tax=Hyalangium gracile TaxID=394092 RepID=UPI001CCAE434|nr:hypothetical protein [Hyalangium gracile]
MEEENGPSSHPPGTVVSLDLELGTLATAIQGARMLADLQARRDLPDAEMERDAPACIVSVLALATERIGQLRRVVRNEENPGNLWAPHNAVEDPATSGEFPGDIVLFSWGSHRLPLVMWEPRGMERQGNAKKRASKAPKGRSRKARGAAPESSEVSEDASSREPAPSAPESHGSERQNG